MLRRRPLLLNAAWLRARIRLGATPVGHRLLASSPFADPRWWLGEETAVSIEGFPRSGNTLAVQAFREWNPRVPLAHHTHLPGEVILAVRRSIPVAVAIRDPADAGASLLVSYEGRQSAGAVLAAYVSYHRALLPVLPRVAICRFDRLVEDPAYLVACLNRSFGTRFHSASMTSGESRALLSRIEAMQRNRGHSSASLSVPSEQRTALRAAAREKILRHRRLAAARALYQRVSQTAEI